MEKVSQIVTRTTSGASLNSSDLWGTSHRKLSIYG